MTTRSQKLADQQTPERQHSGDQRSLHPLERPAISDWAMDTATAINNQYELGLNDKAHKSLAYVIDSRARRAYRKARGIPTTRLESAAPDMLAELIALKKFAAAFGTFRDDMGQGVEAHVDAVIAKATGAQP